MASKCHLFPSAPPNLTKSPITRICAYAVTHGTASFELDWPDEAEITRRYMG